MAKTKSNTSSTRTHLVAPKKKRKGIHSKKKSSRNKKSRNYKKLYRGQGR
jgi:hypothetical protein